MKTNYSMLPGQAMILALIIVALSMPPALAQAGERKRHAPAGHQSSYTHSEGHGYVKRRHARYGYREHVAPAHIVSHEIVYETHRPVHRYPVHAQPYISLNIPLPLPHLVIW